MILLQTFISSTLYSFTHGCGITLQKSMKRALGHRLQLISYCIPYAMFWIVPYIPFHGCKPGTSFVHIHHFCIWTTLLFIQLYKYFLWQITCHGIAGCIKKCCRNTLPTPLVLSLLLFIHLILHFIIMHPLGQYTCNMFT